MPNWCDTTYKISCNETTRKVILDAIQHVEQENELHKIAYDEEKARLEKSGLASSEIYDILREKGLWWHDDVWLYHVLLELGYSKEFLENYRDNFRGYIYSYSEENEEEFVISCETAWCEAYGFRHLLLDKFKDDDPDIDIRYTAEESGMEYFLTNIPDYEGIYIVDIEWDSYDYESEESVIGIVNDRLNLNCTTIEEALDAAKKHNDTTEKDDHIWIHQFEYYED